MKYGHEYLEALTNENFPENWLGAAIAYRDLKKCIKRVQQELLDLGLDAETLNHISRSFEVNKSSSPRLDGQDQFRPELWIAVDSQDGHFLDAGLTHETRVALSKSRPTSPILRGNGFDYPTTRTQDIEAGVDSGSDLAKAKRGSVKWQKIPLFTVRAFFDELEPRLAEQEALQQAEKGRLEHAVTDLGDSVGSLTRPVEKKASHKFKSPQDVAVWRSIFSTYVDSAVFFSSHEQDHGSRTYTKARKQLELFSDRLLKQNLVAQFKDPASRSAFDNFITINLDILRAMRFQEINALAFRKILKKFDKRTSLGPTSAYNDALIHRLPPSMRRNSTVAAPGAAFASSIAKDLCAHLSSQVISTVPQMDDYICPLCCELAWRPIVLPCCKSIFCIRCVIRLQREGTQRCPMCRASSVLDADSGNVDDQTAAFLLRWFPEEVKVRQKANERAAGVDKYGEEFYRSKCVVM